MENSIVQKVTIKEKHQLFKGEEPANSIELLSFEEVGFPIVAQKDLYSIGDVAYLVEPDYCIPDIPLFESYIRPYGDASKSKLGKHNRIRAVKFNLHKGDGNPVFSYGILIPNVEMHLWCTQNKVLITKADLAKELGITKYEGSEESLKGGVKAGDSTGSFPFDMYRTDETNFNKICNTIQFPIHLIGTVKNDGCLEENTFLTTPNGTKTVQELSTINYKGLILSRNLHNSTNEFVKVKNWLVRENTNNWLKITLENGAEIIVTENHPFWLEEEKCYRKAENLILGNILTII